MMENVDVGGVHCEYILPYFSHAHKHRKKEPDGSVWNNKLSSRFQKCTPIFHLVSYSAHKTARIR
jgi:hypothetical protein